MNSPAQSNQQRTAISSTEVRTTQTENWLSNLTGAISDNETLTLEIRQRLATVLRQEPEATCAINQAMPPEEYLVDHADKLRQLEKRVTASNALLRGLLSRCEL